MAATERVRDLLESGSVPDAVAPEITGLGDECTLTKWAESFTGDEGWGDWVSEDMVAAQICAQGFDAIYGRVVVSWFPIDGHWHVQM
jgi:hypothetical protein